MRTTIIKVAMLAALFAFSGITAADWTYRCLMNTGKSARPDIDIRGLLARSCVNYSAISCGETCP